MLNFLLLVLRSLSFFSLLLLRHSPASSQTTSRPYRFNNLNFNWNFPFIILRFCFLRLIIFNFFSWFSFILILICWISIVYSLLSWIIWYIVLLLNLLIMLNWFRWCMIYILLVVIPSFFIKPIWIEKETIRVYKWTILINIETILIISATSWESIFDFCLINLFVISWFHCVRSFLIMLIIRVLFWGMNWRAWRRTCCSRVPNIMRWIIILLSFDSRSRNIFINFGSWISVTFMLVLILIWFLVVTACTTSKFTASLVLKWICLFLVFIYYNPDFCRIFSWVLDFRLLFEMWILIKFLSVLVWWLSVFIIASTSVTSASSSGICVISISLIVTWLFNNCGISKLRCVIFYLNHFGLSQV